PSNARTRKNLIIGPSTLGESSHSITDNLRALPPHALQSPPPSRGRVRVGGGGGGGGARRFRSTQSSHERATPTPTLPQLGGGRSGRDLLYPAPLRDEEGDG